MSNKHRQFTKKHSIGLVIFLLLLVSSVLSFIVSQHVTNTRSRAATSQSVTVQTLLQITPVSQPAVNLTLFLDTLQSVRMGQTLHVATYVQVNKPLQTIHFVYQYDSSALLLDSMSIYGKVIPLKQTVEQKLQGEVIYDYTSPLAINSGGNLITLTFHALQAKQKAFIGISHDTTAKLIDLSPATIQFPQPLLFPIN